MRARQVLAAFIKSGHGEGSRGGHIIGHTKSGHAVYADHHAGSSVYSHFSAHDHRDAAGVHLQAEEQNLLPSIHDNPSDAQLASPAVLRDPTHHHRLRESHHRAAAFLSGEAKKSRLGHTTNYYRIPPASQSMFSRTADTLDRPSFAHVRQWSIDRAIKPVTETWNPMPSVDHEDMARAYEKQATKVSDPSLPALAVLHRAAAQAMAQIEAGSEQQHRQHAQKRARAVQEVHEQRRFKNQMDADTADLLGISTQQVQDMRRPSGARTASGKPILPHHHPVFTHPDGLIAALPSYTAQDHLDAAKHLRDWAGGMLPDRGATASDWEDHQFVLGRSKMHEEAAKTLAGLKKFRRRTRRDCP